MSSLSIRGISESLADSLKRQAKSSNKSVNQFVLDILKTQAGLNKKKKYTQSYHDLDDLFGRWSVEEFESIEAKINQESQVDAEVWK